MNEVVTLLADGSTLDESEAPSVRAGAIALAKAVFARRGRILVYVDSPTLVQMIAAATEYRVVQNLETSERRIPSIILGEALRSNTVEDRLIDYGRDELDYIRELERYGVIENAGDSFQRGIKATFERYSPVAIFLLGRSNRVSGFAEQAQVSHSLFQIPLYSDAEVPWTQGWKRIAERIGAEDGWRSTLEGRLVAGEDSEIVMRADGDAQTALAVETIIDQLISDIK